ncbi:MAG: redoxin family protein, partial [Acidobacteriota bacterium]
MDVKRLKTGFLSGDRRKVIVIIPSAASAEVATHLRSRALSGGDLIVLRYHGDLAEALGQDSGGSAETIPLPRLSLEADRSQAGSLYRHYVQMITERAQGALRDYVLASFQSQDQFAALVVLDRKLGVELFLPKPTMSSWSSWLRQSIVRAEIFVNICKDSKERPERLNANGQDKSSEEKGTVVSRSMRQSPLAVPLPTRTAERLRVNMLDANAIAVDATELGTPVKFPGRFNLRRSQGKWLVVVFWGSWCPPCIAELPFIERLSTDYPEDIAVVGVAWEAEPTREQSLARIRSTVKRLDLTFPQYLDHQREVYKSIIGESIAYPRTAIFDRIGELHRITEEPIVSLEDTQELLSLMQMVGVDDRNSEAGSVAAGQQAPGDTLQEGAAPASPTPSQFNFPDQPEQPASESGSVEAEQPPSVDAESEVGGITQPSSPPGEAASESGPVGAEQQPASESGSVEAEQPPSVDAESEVGGVTQPSSPPGEAASESGPVGA